MTFDREWSFDELVDAPFLEQIGPALALLLGGDLGILDARNRLRWGGHSPSARVEAIAMELEPVAFLASASASTAALKAASRIVEEMLRAQMRFRMASTLHLEATADDYEALCVEHAHLLASEAKYKQLSEQLEMRVKAQVEELESRRQSLYQAEKHAAVGRLAAGMAHEINNPLSFARSNLSSLDSYLRKFQIYRDSLPEADRTREIWQALDLDFILEDAKELIAESAGGLERIAHIVQDLKDFSNVDRADVEFGDINDCVRQSVAMVEPLLPAGVSITQNLAPLPPIMLMRGYVNQSLFNVIQNAIQALECFNPPARIAISTEMADGNLIRVSVSDNGAGMAPEIRDRACDPFFTTREVGAGAGLGLTLARNVMVAHGGALSIKSAPGEGTTVTLDFPLEA